MTVKLLGVLFCVAIMAVLGACSKTAQTLPTNSTTVSQSVDGSTGSADVTTRQTGGEESATSSTAVPGQSTTSGVKTTAATTTKTNDNAVMWEDLTSSTKTTSTDGKKVTATTATTTTTTTTTAPTTTLPTKQEQVKNVSLPAEGYTPDGKIQLGAVKLTGNTVSVEIKNITKGRETDQDSCFEYTCYDEDGKQLKRGEIRFGRIHKQQSRTCEFTIPEDTVKVELTDFVVKYWTDGFI